MRALLFLVVAYFTAMECAAAETYWVRLSHTWRPLATGLVPEEPDTANGPNEPIIFKGQILPGLPSIYDAPGTVDGNDGYVDRGATIVGTRDAANNFTSTGYWWAIAVTAWDQSFLVGSKPDPTELIGGDAPLTLHDDLNMEDVTFHIPSYDWIKVDVLCGDDRDKIITEYKNNYGGKRIFDYLSSLESQQPRAKFLKGLTLAGGTTWRASWRRGSRA
jgi:hypothetical protein